jgi:uncharacterized protein YwbE
MASGGLTGPLSEGLEVGAKDVLVLLNRSGAAPHGIAVQTLDCQIADAVTIYG